MSTKYQLSSDRFKASLFDISAAFLAVIVAVFFRFGYASGVDDQLVLSLRGISLADQSAFLNDWMIAHATQPHWLFDYITFFGEKFGILPTVYLLYWSVNALAFSVAICWFAEYFNEKRLIYLMPVLSVIGPFFILGTINILYRLALPHLLGGSVLFLCMAAFFTNRWRLAISLIPVVLIIHVQHGANLIGLTILSVLFKSDWTFLRRMQIVALMLLFLAGVVVISAKTNLDQSSNFAAFCYRYTPGHCNASTWSLNAWYTGILCTILVTWMVWFDGRNKRLWFTLVVAPLLLLIAGSLADYFDLSGAAWIVRRFFLYRFAAVFIPLGALSLSLLFLKSTTSKQAFISIIALCAWLSTLGSTFESNRIAIGLGTLSSIGFFLSQTRLQSFSAIALWLPLWYSTPPPADPIWISEFGKVIQNYTQSGAVIAVSPSFTWFRLATRRAMIVDVKYLPYGGEASAEWERRINDLGGFDWSGRQFLNLSFEQLEAAARKYSADYAILTEGDPKNAKARQKWQGVVAYRTLTGNPNNDSLTLNLYKIPANH